MKRTVVILAAVMLLLALAAPVAAKKPRPAAVEAPTIAISDPNPSYGDTITVTATASVRGVWNIVCTQDGVVVFGDGGNATASTSTLASLAWTGGAADCVANAIGQDQQGDPFIAASLSFEVAP